MNYNPIARNYDWLSRLVFGRAQVNAQKNLLKYIHAGSKILIVGGGTGWILEELTKLHQKRLTIDYVEASGTMLQLSAKRKTGENNVDFIGQNIEDYQTKTRYDAVLTFFLFDNFQPRKGHAIFAHINSLTKPGGIWLYADFVPQKQQMPLWQKMIFKIMYAFFRLLCNVEAKRMMDTAALFTEKYAVKSATKYYAGFIEGKVCLKIL